MANSAQEKIWNDVVGETWVRNVTHFDATLEPFGHAAMAALDLQTGERVIDIGAGVGSTTIDLASRVAPGEVLGVDLSEVMLDEARKRIDSKGITNADFLHVDVQTGKLGSGAFDVAFSRVGVMFFPDPDVAFSNIASSLIPGGRLGFVCFQSPMVNPFLTTPILAAAELLVLPPMPGLDSPGPFSLADAEKTKSLLQRSGFIDIAIEPGPDEAVLHDAEDLHALAERCLQQNPMTAPRMAAVDQGTRSAAIRAGAESLEPYLDGDLVRLGAGTWIVTGRIPG